jgi:phytoene dehydrogenase-like protein
MAYDAVVVGAGIGGLTVAALLSKRGLNTCLLERQSQVGGCIGRIEFSGFDFEPGMGLYPSWGPGQICERLFAELSVDPPAASLIEDDYVVRLPDAKEVKLRKDDAQFVEELRVAFPECSQAAVEFYEHVIRLDRHISQTAVKEGSAKSRWKFWTTTTIEKDLEHAATQTTLSFAKATSPRFQRFIEAQLKGFLHLDSEHCSFLSACEALSLPRRNLYSIEGGVATLAERLAESIKSSGGTIRLNSPVLRLAYNETGDAIGLDLLSGERVLATRAIISNLTIWDTYGKLIGLNKTPASIKSALAKLQGSGAYITYAAVEGSARTRLPAPNFLVADSESNTDENLSGESTVTIREARADGKSAATIKTGTDVVPWFSYQSSHEDYEQWDQETLEHAWAKLHRAVPEFGSGIEVIETANPRTYYEQSRRKLGMIMGATAESVGFQRATELSITLPNVFIVGDTVSSFPEVDAVIQSAMLLADRLTDFQPH